MKRSSQCEQTAMESAEEYIQRVMNDGSKIPMKFEKFAPPSWYDDGKFRRGQQFIRENYFILSLSMVMMPFFLVIEQKFDKLFTMTGKYDTFNVATRHILLFFDKIRSWSEGDIYDKKSKSYKTLYKTSATHERNTLIYVDSKMGISQKDMVSGIFSHVWLVISEYDYFHGKSTSECDRMKFEGFIHYWRVIGHHMGLTDEFNLCGGSPYEVKKKCDQVFQNIFKPVLDEPPQNVGVLHTHTINLARCMCFIADSDGMVEFARRVYKLPQKPLKNKKSRIFVSVMTFIREKMLKTWYISPIARPILNYLAKIIEEFLPPLMLKLFGYLM